MFFLKYYSSYGDDCFLGHDRVRCLYSIYSFYPLTKIFLFVLELRRTLSSFEMNIKSCSKLFRCFEFIKHQQVRDMADYVGNVTSSCHFFLCSPILLHCILSKVFVIIGYHHWSLIQSPQSVFVGWCIVLMEENIFSLTPQIWSHESSWSRCVCIPQLRFFPI